MTSGFTTTMKPMTIWSPCKGRAEITPRRFNELRFVETTEFEASALWDAEMVRVRGC